MWVPAWTKAVEQPPTAPGISRVSNASSPAPMPSAIPDRRTSSPGAGAARGRGPGYQGPVAVRRAEIPVRSAATWELGERNGVYVTNVEHKMGLKSSPTCELTFGGENEKPAVGWLVGDNHNGIAQMFKVIENARMMVGVKPVATLSTGYLNALAYAKEPGAGRRSDPDGGQGRAAGRHQPPSGRATQPGYDPEGLCRGYARGLPLHRDSSERRYGWGTGFSGWTPKRRTGSTISCCLIVKGVGSERAYPRSD